MIHKRPWDAEHADCTLGHDCERECNADVEVVKLPPLRLAAQNSLVHLVACRCSDDDYGMAGVRGN